MTETEFCELDQQLVMEIATLQARRCALDAQQRDERKAEQAQRRAEQAAEQTARRQKHEAERQRREAEQIARHAKWEAEVAKQTAAKAEREAAKAKQAKAEQAEREAANVEAAKVADPLYRFINEHCFIAPGITVSLDDFYVQFFGWLPTEELPYWNRAVIVNYLDGQFPVGKLGDGKKYIGNISFTPETGEGRFISHRGYLVLEQ